MKAAFDREIINPILPVGMEGYTEARFQLNQSEAQLAKAPEEGLRQATGIRDDLLMDTILFSDGEKEMFFFILDVGMIEKRTADQARKYLLENCNVDPESVSISVGHTHNGPLVTTGIDFELPYNEEYWQMIFEKMSYAVRQCRRNLTEVHAEYDCHPINGYYNNRNHPEEAYFDKAMELTVYTEKNIPLFRLLNIACHPTILGIQNVMISNDFFAVLRRYIQGYTGIPVSIINGEAGDVSPRLMKKGTDWNEAIRYGEGIGAQLLDSHMPIKVDLDHIKKKWVRFHVDYVPAENEFLLATKAKLQKEISTLQPGSRRYKMATQVELYDVNDKLSKDRITFDTEALTVDFGGFRIVAVPCEIDTVLGTMIRNIDDKPTFLAAYSNGFDYYAVNKDEFGQVFESFVTHYPYGDADSFVEKIVNEAKKL